MREIQRGSSQDLIIFYLVGSQLDDAIVRALGDGPTIITFGDARGSTPFDVASSLGFDRVRSLVVCGYSEGCKAVRAALRAGAIPIADRLGVVCIDGTHASKPADDWQINVWKNLANDARRGDKLFVATCTNMTYVEHLHLNPFLATITVLRAAIDATLAPNSPPDERHEGDLHVYAYASDSIDTKAHIAQQRETLPMVLGKHVRPWFDRVGFDKETKMLASEATAIGLDRLTREV